jgi:hypothetical protein
MKGTLLCYLYENTTSWSPLKISTEEDVLRRRRKENSHSAQNTLYDRAIVGV